MLMGPGSADRGLESLREFIWASKPGAQHRRSDMIMPPDRAGGRETEGHRGCTRTGLAVTMGRLNGDQSGNL